MRRFVSAIPLFSFGGDHARLGRGRVFVLRLGRRAFVPGWFFICGRFAKSVKVGIHRRGVCNTARLRAGTNPRRSAPFGLLAPSISRHRWCSADTAWNTCGRIRQPEAILQNASAFLGYPSRPRGRTRGREAFGLPQPARRRFPVSRNSSEAFFTTRFRSFAFATKSDIG